MRKLLGLILLCAFPSVSIAADEQKSVLVLYSYSRLMPAVFEADQGLREGLPDVEAKRVGLYEEFFDEPRFGGEAYSDLMVQLLRGKYGSRPPDVIVAGGFEALRFLLTHRERLFPGVPVVHEGIMVASVPSLPSLPSDVIGNLVDPDVPRTLALALRLHPRATRLVVVTGKSPGHDREWEQSLRADVASVRGRVAVEFLSGLPHEQVLGRLAALGNEAVVFTPGYLMDGDGRAFNPLEALRGMLSASTAPIYVPYDTMLGSGVVGGYTRTFRTAGRETGRLADALLKGADPATLRVPPPEPATLYLDWREIRRWGINDRLIPDDAIVQYRRPSLWDAYREQLIIGGLALLLQALLILWLLTERFRRRRAERTAEKQRFELAHASRRAVAGELTAAIAHEINQPLGAILSNAEAAELMLDSGADRRVELREILADIRRDDLRAGEVIRRLRTLLAGREGEQKSFDVNELVLDAVAIVRSEAARRGVALEARTAAVPVSTVGDRIQLQQVLINLILNAADAVVGCPEAQRLVTLSVTASVPGGMTTLTVRDRGQGIPEANLSRIFDSFFTTKGHGMGLGLSIARTLVEAHGGRIHAANHPDGGALFSVELRQT
jgi:signal transduction histidine kinase